MLVFSNSSMKKFAKVGDRGEPMATPSIWSRIARSDQWDQDLESLMG